MIDIGSLYTRIEADTSGLNKAETNIAAFAKRAAGYFAGIASVAAIGAAIKEVTFATARFDTLGVVMEVVGKNAGYSAREMAKYEQELRKTGISMTSARETLTKMSQAQIDLSKSSELARIAQDAAVIGNINSSEAFERMIMGIRSGEIEILRTIGLNVSFQNSYVEMAASLHKTTAELTESEKATARMNSVLAEGPKIAGAYAGAMETPMKKWLSLQRYVDDIKVKLGVLFQPAFGVLVDSITDGLKKFGNVLNETNLKGWGENIKSVLEGTIAFGKAIQDLSNALGTPGIGQLAIVGGVLAKFGPQAAIAAAGVLTLNNELEKTQTGSIQQGARAYKGFAENIQNLLDVAAGTRDFNTGRILTEVEKVERKIAGLKNQKATWSLFPDPGEMERQASIVKAKISELEKSILDAKIKDAIQESISDPWKSAPREAAIAQRAMENSLKSFKDNQARSLKTLQDEYEKHADAIKKISDEIAQNQMSGEELIRSLRQSGMDDFSAWKDIKKEAQEYEQAAEKAAKAGNFDEAVKYADMAQERFVKLNKEVKEGDKTLVSTKQGVAEAIAGVERMIQLRDEALKGSKQIEIDAANSVIKESNFTVAAQLFEDVKTKSNEITMQTFPAMGAAFDKAWKDGANSANVVFTNIDQSLNKTATRISETLWAVPKDGAIGIETEVKKIGETWTNVSEGAKKGSAETAKKQVEDVKGVGKEIKLIDGVWTNVWEDAAKAADSAIDKMLTGIKKVQSEASKIKISEKAAGGSVAGFFMGGAIQALRLGGQAIHAAAGQYFPGYGGGDKIPIMGEAGEVMIRKERQREVGVGTTLAYNAGDWKTVVQNLLPKLRMGGPVMPGFPRQAFAMGGPIQQVSQESTSESIRKYFIAGSPEPITVRADNRNGDRLFSELQRKFHRRS